jgi:hypothetical protein
MKLYKLFLTSKMMHDKEFEFIAEDDADAERKAEEIHFNHIDMNPKLALFRIGEQIK